jgi:capsular polysaccharide biosynthesis protein
MILRLENIAKIKGLIKQDLEKKTQIRSYTLNATKKKLFENIIITESEKIAYMAKLKALKSAKADIEERIRTLPQLEKQYALLKRKRDKAEEMYNLLSKSAEEARLASEKTTSNFELIELSENAVKILPKTGLNCILGLIIGIALSLVTVILTEFNDKSLRTPSQLKRYLPFELIETLPLLKARPQELLDVRENEYLMRKFQFISSSIYGQETLMR